jgi:ATP-dependent RNA helicase DeaD
MLAFGFIEDIETILAELPEKRQVALFSATMPPRIANLAKKFMPNAETVAIRSLRRTVETVEQSYYEVPPGKKQDALARVLDMETPGPTIVFCRTKAETDALAEGLRLRGYSADALHGDMAQAERDRVMRRFREGLADLLVATDVAARGLDIDTVTHVINYDLPWDVEQYIHRIGRTGRAGRTGDAITLIEPRERRNLRMIEQMTGAKIAPTRIPTVADISARRREIFRDTLHTRLEKGEYDGQIGIVEELSTEFPPAEVAAVALQMLWEATHGKNSSPDEAEEEIAAEAGRAEQGMTKLFIAMGRQDGLRPGDLVGAITNEVGLPGKSVGTIDILDRTAFVEVPTGDADAVIAALSKTKLRGRRVKVGLAAKPGRN